MSDLDKIFKAYDVRGVVPDQLDESVAEAVGAAFVRLTGAKTIVTLHDMRATSGPLADAIGRGATSQGADVIRGGLGSTDMVYYASGSLGVAGAMITASHNPAKYNGIKLCKVGAKPVGVETGLAEIKAMVEHGVPTYDGEPGTTTDRDLLPGYAEFLKKLVDISGIRPLKVVVDAGNGMGGYTVPTVFEGLPITLVPLYFELDGSFPNHEANPIDAENLRDLQAAVREHKADIGLAFDGDADRCFIVDERGEIVSPSVLAALIATRELAREPGAVVIHNLITSRAVPELVVEHGGTPVKTRVGHSYIKAKMSENNAIFGGEHSGHFYFRDFWFADSGMLAALHALAALGHDSRTAVGHPQRFLPLRRQRRDQQRGLRPGRRDGQDQERLLRTDRGYPRRARWSHRRRGYVVVQRPSLEHRAAATAERGGVGPSRGGGHSRRGARADRHLVTPGSTTLNPRGMPDAVLDRGTQGLSSMRTLGRKDLVWKLKTG